MVVVLLKSEVLEVGSEREGELREGREVVRRRGNVIIEDALDKGGRFFSHGSKAFFAISIPRCWT